MKAKRATKNLCHGLLQQRLDELAEHRLLQELLDRIPDARLRILLFFRHELGLSWPAIWEAAPRHRMYYSERQIYRLYAQALKLAAELLEANPTTQETGKTRKRRSRTIRGCRLPASNTTEWRKAYEK